MGSIRVLAVVCLAALAACPTVNLGDTPEGIGACIPKEGLPYFKEQIWPMYLDPPNPAQTCVRTGCHDTDDARGGIGLNATPPVDYMSNFSIVQPKLDCEVPSASQLLTSPLNFYGDHGGGQIFTMSDPQYSIFLNWFQ